MIDAGLWATTGAEGQTDRGGEGEGKGGPPPGDTGVCDALAVAREGAGERWSPCGLAH